MNVNDAINTLLEELHEANLVKAKMREEIERLQKLVEEKQGSVSKSSEQ